MIIGLSYSWRTDAAHWNGFLVCGQRVLLDILLLLDKTIQRFDVLWAQLIRLLILQLNMKAIKVLYKTNIVALQGGCVRAIRSFLAL